MNSFDSLNKRIPLKETPEYISGLVDRCAENAIARATRSRAGIMRRVYVATAAAAAVLAGVLLWHFNESASLDQAEIIAASPDLDTVLNSLSYEETQALYTYSVDEIPKY